MVKFRKGNGIFSVNEPCPVVACAEIGNAPEVSFENLGLQWRTICSGVLKVTCKGINADKQATRKKRGSHIAVGNRYK